MPESAGLFLKALQYTGYTVPMIKCVELLAAVLFLLNRFLPLAIVIITPGIVNILVFLFGIGSWRSSYGGVIMQFIRIVVVHRKDAFKLLLP